ncbi:MULTISPECIES: DUF995 domain-containing protein [Phyllobacteriaceae]|jgi:hypothetical protein|uniref:DUF995 domain-containing protein n=1 Tax=Mesorhizobium hungaricum TaxID=1566387 RepID=A0A1C2DNV6_9HYPH|nr:MULTISPECIES: DUF995 domain-containing protein [Mesorhizobium]MBN9233622.1 DUF995 domain-containing protein [Mesorhizobium sp.]MDQ0328570.1 hypothetical protein [Mesorhizobium sp. YL-MeA3-2017]OCX16457.1 hypothetical protein QV13_16705 [Mesorhizobium hungaricum]
MSAIRNILLLLVAGTVAGTGTASAAAPSAAVIEKAKPLNDNELYRLYSQRSWMWKDGAGYFAIPMRRFTAWSGRGKTLSYGVGTWFITDPGKLCFRADWHAMGGAKPDLTCFSHRKKGDVVYQKREPKGDWYVFANAPVRKDDEARKLRHGDYVSHRLTRIEAKLDH